MTHSRTLLFLIVVVWALLVSGCAGVIEFQMPDRFKGEKLKEDPPGTFLVPAGPARTGVC
jgi:hypothetical protein